MRKISSGLPRRRRAQGVSAACGLALLAILAVAVAPTRAAAGAASIRSPYLIEQRSAGSTLQLVLAPSGLRFEVYAPLRSGGRLRKGHPSLLAGMIVLYHGSRLLMLDPAHRTFHPMALRSAISSYEAELRVLTKAQPSARLPPPPGVKRRKGQAPLRPPRARLHRLSLSMRIGSIRAQAYLLTQGSLRERVWYSGALPEPPRGVRSLLRQALGGSAAGPLSRALAAHASQIPLRVDERAGRHWQVVLRTATIRRVRPSARWLRPPGGYRKRKLPAPRAMGAETPASPVRCGILLISGALGCTSLGADLTGLAGPISEHPAIWADYWGAGFADHPDYVSAINHGLENMVGDQFADPNSQDYWGPLSQYGVHQGRFLGYQVITDNPDSTVGSWNFFDVVWFVLGHRWGSDAPHYWWRYSDQDPIFAIFVDESKVDSSAWAGYHAFAPTEGVLFSFLVHVAMPFFIVKVPALDSLPNDHSSLAWHDAVDTATERASHEFVEAATDPYPFTSWADPLQVPIWGKGEIADICNVGNHYPWGTATRVLQDSTALSPYWSNDANACVPDAQPDVQLVYPQPGSTYNWGDRVTFAVKTNDLFDNGPVADGRIHWTADGHPIGTGPILETSSLSPGKHEISVEVEDSVGGVRTVGPVTIHVVAQPPTVRIDTPAPGDTFAADQKINFRGYARDLHDGDLGPKAVWSVDGSPVGQGASLFRYDITSQGTHTVTLSATNGAGLSNSASVSVNIGPATGKPSVAITGPADNSTFSGGTPIMFTADGEAAGSATISSYSWSDDVDGQLGTGSSITKTLSGSNCQAVTHHVTVTVSDSAMQTATDTITVTVGGVC